MKYKVVNTTDHYEKILRMDTKEDKEKFYRYSSLGEFKEMWNLLNVPLKSQQGSGYDVLVASKMLGFVDITDEDTIRSGLSIIKKSDSLHTAERALRNCMRVMEQANLHVSSDEIKLGLYIADPEKLKLQQGYTGFGGIPGYITIMIYPNEHNLPKIPAIIAHEFHHNVRFSYFSWDHGNVTLGDYLVIEGLADSFAKELYGIDYLGHWVTDIDEEDLLYSIYVIEKVLSVKGFAEVRSYMFGDVLAKQEGYQPVGLSFCAGYAVGYHIVQSFMRNTGSSIYEATLLSSAEIIKGSGVFNK